MMKEPITLAMTGASGAQYGLRLLQCLLQTGHEIYLLLSKPARLVIDTETDLDLPSRRADIAKYLVARYGGVPGQLHLFGREEWMAPPASGSARIAAMVVCPCTTATLSALANGASRSLIERAADVMLKERRKLIVVPRETPLSSVHLRNMLTLSDAGAVVLPANPGFYHQPASIDDLVDFVVARILDHLDVDHDVMPRWGAPRER
ncbi:MAG TPA: flavin prenyltransferase UbiX [Gammaproteobacteria bacterium]|nr:flavin prenyltransferase UbiX [Gammaproteobacteria bacterium]